jgi:hypothetical protein
MIGPVKPAVPLYHFWFQMQNILGALFLSQTHCTCLKIYIIFLKYRLFVWWAIFVKSEDRYVPQLNSLRNFYCSSTNINSNEIFWEVLATKYPERRIDLPIKRSFKLL